MRSRRLWLCSSALVAALAGLSPFGESSGGAQQALAGPVTPNETVGGIYQTGLALSSGQTSTLNLDSTGNLMVDVAAGGGAGGTSSNFGAAFPGTGTAAGFHNAGGNMDYAGVDASHDLDVNCVVGCAGGTFNNNADAVATSATNGQAAAWLYGFNGTTWDRLRSDTSKYLFVDVGAGTLAATQSGSWNVGQSGSWTVTANQGGAPWSSNITQFGGSNVATGTGASGSGIPRVTVSNDSQVKPWDGTTAITVKPASTAPAAADTALVVAQSPNATGCDGQPLSAMHYTPINLTASGQIITGAASKQTYICALNITAPNNAVAFVEGTGSTCGTATAGIAGGTTAATGWVFNNATAPGVGLTEGDGKSSIMATATQADNVCILVSASTQVSGSIKWVQY